MGSFADRLVVDFVLQWLPLTYSRNLIACFNFGLPNNVNRMLGTSRPTYLNEVKFFIHQGTVFHSSSSTNGKVYRQRFLYADLCWDIFHSMFLIA